VGHGYDMPAWAPGVASRIRVYNRETWVARGQGVVSNCCIFVIRRKRGHLPRRSHCGAITASEPAPLPSSRCPGGAPCDPSCTAIRG